jgi:hypothetical protein
VEFGFVGVIAPTILATKLFSKTFEKPLDKPHTMWYNKGVKRKGERPHQIRLTITHWLVNANATNKNRQFCKFPLDNRHKMW